MPSIYALIEDAASAAGRAQAKQFGQEVAAEARKALEEGKCSSYHAARMQGRAQGRSRLVSKISSHRIDYAPGADRTIGGGRTGLRHAKMPAAMGGQRSAGTAQNQIERPCSRARLIVQ